MKPISQHIFQRHVQSLRQIFVRRFEARYGDGFVLRADPVAGPGMSVALQRSASTNNAINDRVCALLITVGQRRILCSFFESWKLIRPKKPEYQFDKAAMAFFLGVPQGNDFVNEQMFRLEWDNWQNQDHPNKAAYPHWQFDRWLTAPALTITDWPSCERALNLWNPMP